MTEQKSVPNQNPERESYQSEYHRLKQELDEVISFMGKEHAGIEKANTLRKRIKYHDDYFQNKLRVELEQKQLDRLISCLLAIAPVALFILASVTEAESIAVAARISLVVAPILLCLKNTSKDLYFEQLQNQDQQNRHVDAVLDLTAQLKEFLSHYEIVNREIAPRLETIPRK